MQSTGPPKSSGARRSSSALARALPWILTAEVVIDLIPTEWALDWLLIPAELVLDAVLFAAVALGPAKGTREIAGPRHRPKGRRALTRGSGIVILGFWAIFAAIIFFQGWYATQHPILTLFFGIFELGFDLLLVIVGFIVTIWGLRAQGAAQGREIGSGR